MEQGKQVEDDAKLSPLLNDLRTKNPFKVPQDYFGHTEDKIMNKIRKTKKGKPFSLHLLPNIGLGMAASLLLSIGIYTFLSPSTPQKMSTSELQSALKSLPKEDLDDYIMTNSNSLNDDLIAQTLDFNRHPYQFNIKNLDSTTIDTYINDIDQPFLTEQN